MKKSHTKKNIDRRSKICSVSVIVLNSIPLQNKNRQTPIFGNVSNCVDLCKAILMMIVFFYFVFLARTIYMLIHDEAKFVFVFERQSKCYRIKEVVKILSK